MKNNNLNKQKGFTLIETMVSVFILTIALSAFMTTVASSLSAARYANNEITANYLAQEVVDGLHNDRDTFFQRQANIFPSVPAWGAFTTKYGAPSSYCFSTDGCEIDVHSLSQCANITECSVVSIISTCSTSPTFGTIRCQMLNFDKDLEEKYYYGYWTGTPSIFKRQVKMTPNGNDHLDVLVKVEWKNGNSVRSRELRSTLTNWQQ